MKKIILSLFLSLVIFLYKAPLTFAGCVNRGFLGCDSRHSNACGDGNTCCFTSNECSQYPDTSDPCSYVCRGPQEAVLCVQCRGGELTPLGGGNVSDPMAGCSGNSINTAIGCIPVEKTNEFMGWILGWAVGVGGGIAFLLIVYASFMVMTSQGDPTRLKAGQELLTSAISGLIMLIFSVFILKFIGIDILGLDNL